MGLHTEAFKAGDIYFNGNAIVILNEKVGGLDEVAIKDFLGDLASYFSGYYDEIREVYDPGVVDRENLEKERSLIAAGVSLGFKLGKKLPNYRALEDLLLDSGYIKARIDLKHLHKTALERNEKLAEAIK